MEIHIPVCLEREEDQPVVADAKRSGAYFSLLLNIHRVGKYAELLMHAVLALQLHYFCHVNKR